MRRKPQLTLPAMVVDAPPKPPISDDLALAIAQIGIRLDLIETRLAEIEARHDYEDESERNQE